ncbi:N-acyl homoserine lactonase family protein [Paraburkholderia sediminicola]|uniref:N-acyl homoserine lactonase family protein n=1 Tax=Paraburkholderia sediminicola TaxID=458836 RepID=UPI0038BA26C8
MSRELPTYEVYALRYATVERRRRDNFIVGDAHDMSPMPMDYYVWLICGAGRTYLVDTGFNEAAARERGRMLLRCPIQALTSFGLAPEMITDVIVTHLHYDHAGNLGLLPEARIHLQESEMHYATGRYMRHGLLRHAYAVEDVLNVVRGVYDDRVEFRRGDEDIADGLQVIHVGGHTAGLQAVRVHTARGWIVIASDASHFYDNIQQASPFPIVLHVGEMLDGYQRLLSLCASPDHLIPGHDPLVLRRYPRWKDPAWDIVMLHRHPGAI